MKLGVLAFGLSVSLAGSASAQQAPPAPPTAPAAVGSATTAPFSPAAIDRDLAQAREWLELTLVDYDSARFRDVRAVIVSPRSKGQRQVYLGICGMVNAQNRMGGYTGFERFFFAPTVPHPQNRETGYWAEEWCKTASPVNAEDYASRLSPAR